MPRRRQRTGPVSPTNLAAAPLSSSEIKLTWTDRATNETDYWIERSLNGTAFTPLVRLPAQSTSYTNTGLTASTQYWYRVRSANPVNYSAWAGTVTATTLGVAQPPPPPPPPTGWRTIFASDCEEGPLSSGAGNFSKCRQAIFNSGGTSGIVAMGTPAAASGRYALWTSITGDQGCRLCVQRDDGNNCSGKLLPKEFRITVKVFIPSLPSGISWWQVLQNKQTEIGGGGSGYNEPTVALNLNPQGRLVLYLKGSTPGSIATAPNSSLIAQPLPNQPVFPLGRWVAVVMHTKHSTGADGFCRVWVNGVQQFAYSGRTCREGRNQVDTELNCYPATNYGGLASGSTGVIYYDDFVIDTPN